MQDCAIYVALFPCNECAKAIIQSGIKEVVYLSDKYQGTDSNISSKKMFQMSGVRLRQLVLDKQKIEISFDIKGIWTYSLLYLSIKSFNIAAVNPQIISFSYL